MNLVNEQMEKAGAKESERGDECGWVKFKRGVDSKRLHSKRQEKRKNNRFITKWL